MSKITDYTEAQILVATDLANGIIYQASDTEVDFYAIGGKPARLVPAKGLMSFTANLLDNVTDINVDGEQEIPIFGVEKYNTLGIQIDSTTEITFPYSGTYLVLGSVGVDVTGSGNKDFVYTAQVQTSRDNGVTWENYGLPIEGAARKSDTGAVLSVGDVRAGAPVVVTAGEKMRITLTKVSSNVGNIANYIQGSYISLIYIG